MSDDPYKAVDEALEARKADLLRDLYQLPERTLSKAEAEAVWMAGGKVRMRPPPGNEASPDAMARFARLLEGHGMSNDHVADAIVQVADQLPPDKLKAAIVALLAESMTDAPVMLVKKPGGR